MTDLTIVYWRDIPAQVIAGKGRRAEKLVLPERFEAAIDRAAMKSGATGTDAYLAGWRRCAAPQTANPAGDTAAALAARLAEDYDPERLRALVDRGGWAAQPADVKGP